MRKRKDNEKSTIYIPINLLEIEEKIISNDNLENKLNIKYDD